MNGVLDTTVIVHLLRRDRPVLNGFNNRQVYTHNLKDMAPLIGALALKPYA